MANHRLHDFVELGQRIFSASGISPDEFVRLMDNLRRESGTEIAQGDAFIVATCGVLRKAAAGPQAGEKLPGWNAWFPNGIVSIRLADGSVLIGIRAKYFVSQLLGASLTGGGDWLPKNERELSGALIRTTPIFSDIGIRVGKREPSKGHGYWEFYISADGVADLSGREG